MDKLLTQHLILEALKKGEIIKNTAKSPLYFALVQDKIWVRNEHVRLHLSLEEFIELYGQESFMPHAANADIEIDAQKDLEYYQWWK